MGPEHWSLKAEDCFIQVVSNTGFTVYIFEPCSVKIGLHASKNGIEPYQAVQCRHADMGKNLLLFVNFMRV